MFLKILSLFCILISLVACSTKRTDPPIAGFSIFPPLQYPFKDTPIRAGRVSWLWGNHDSVHGVDVGMIGNIVNKDFNGTAFSTIFHSTGGKATLWGQMSGITNINRGKAEIEALQFAGITNIARGENIVYGLQFAGLANIGKKNKVYGFQMSAYNQAESIYGLQIGLVNITKNLYGVQLGLANFSKNNGLPFCPILNVGF